MATHRAPEESWRAVVVVWLWRNYRLLAFVALLGVVVALAWGAVAAAGSPPQAMPSSTPGSPHPSVLMPAPTPDVVFSPSPYAVPGPTKTVTVTRTVPTTVTQTVTQTITETAPPVTVTATVTQTETVTAPPVTATVTVTVGATP